MSKEVKGNGSKAPVELKGTVTRKEFAEVLSQLTENLNQTNNYLLEDLNTLYAQHLFPNEIKMAVLEELVVSAGLITEAGLVDKYNTRVKELQEQAKVLQEQPVGESGEPGEPVES